LAPSESGAAKRSVTTVPLRKTSPMRSRQPALARSTTAAGRQAPARLYSTPSMQNRRDLRRRFLALRIFSPNGLC
jgi:hypothetical protein